MYEFKQIKVRVGAIIQCEDKIVLIHRNKNGSDSYTLPGGNLEDGEDVEEAINRELKEELNINARDIAKNRGLLAIQDQMVSRPGSTPSPRKLHFIFGMEVNPNVKETLSSTETDDLGEGNVVWIDKEHAASLHIYPAIGPFLQNLMSDEEKSQLTLLPPMNNNNFTWR